MYLATEAIRSDYRTTSALTADDERKRFPRLFTLRPHSVISTVWMLHSNGGKAHAYIKWVTIFLSAMGECAESLRRFIQVNYCSVMSQEY